MSKLYKIKICECIIEVKASSPDEACSEALLAIVENPHQLETEVIEEPDDNGNELDLDESWFSASNNNTTSSYRPSSLYLDLSQYAGFTHYEAKYSYL